MMRSSRPSTNVRDLSHKPTWVHELKAKGPLHRGCEPSFPERGEVVLHYMAASVFFFHIHREAIAALLSLLYTPGDRSRSAARE